jgi:hypothetical protein
MNGSQSKMVPYVHDVVTTLYGFNKFEQIYTKDFRGIFDALQDIVHCMEGTNVFNEI